MGVAAFLGASEGIVRLSGPEAFGVEPSRVDDLRAFLDHGPKLYVAHPYVGYVVKSQRPDDPTRPRGWSFDLPPRAGVPRIACLGGSTTWTGYPQLLAREIGERTGTQPQVMNWGVPGWSTAETLVNYFLDVQDYAPDIVVLHHSVNDVRPRRTKGFRSDYGNWRRPWRDGGSGVVTSFLLRHSDLCALLALKGGHEDELEDHVPQANIDRRIESLDDMPSGSEKSFERNMRAICQHAQRQGSRVVLVTMPYNASLAVRPDGGPELWAEAMKQHNQILRDIAAEEGALLVDLEERMRSATGQGVEYFNDRVHMTHPGVLIKARAIAAALIDAGYVEGRP